jgi:WD40 repeat protein
VSFTPDGARLVATPAFWETGDISILDATTLETTHVVGGAHQAGIRVMTISAAGDRIVTGGEDGVVNVHDLTTYELTHSLRIADDKISNVLFVNDDRNLLIAPSHGPVMIMTLDTPELLALARDRLTRGFTQGECDRYRLDPCPSWEETQAGS